MDESEFDAEPFKKWLNDAFNDSTFKSFAEIAKKIKVSRTTISSYASARPQTVSNKPSRPKRENVIALAKLLKKDVDEALLLAGHAPTKATQSEIDEFAAKLVQSARASGFDRLEDEDLKQNFLDDMQKIAEFSLNKQLAEQEKRKNKK